MTSCGSCRAVSAVRQHTSMSLCHPSRQVIRPAGWAEFAADGVQEAVRWRRVPRGIDASYFDAVSGIEARNPPLAKAGNISVKAGSSRPRPPTTGPTAGSITVPANVDELVSGHRSGILSGPT